MELYTSCKFCGAKIDVNSAANNRKEMMAEKGNPFLSPCRKCKKEVPILVTEVLAKESIFVILFALEAVIVVSAVAWKGAGWYGVAAASLFFVLVWGHQRINIWCFNRSKILPPKK